VLGSASRLFRNVVPGVGEPGRLRWRGPWFRGTPFGWGGVLPELPPLAIRWRWVLLLAVALVLARGEFGPAASAIIALP
jgi:hypothetical protein